MRRFGAPSCRSIKRGVGHITHQLFLSFSYHTKPNLKPSQASPGRSQTLLEDILTRDIAWLGSASVGVTSDRMGRRKAIAFGCAWGVLGGALMAGAAHVAMRECSRVLSWFIARSVSGN
jgi:hypothetical protein